jgi:hypothetical protein
MDLLPVDMRVDIFQTIESRLNEKAKKQGGVNMTIPYITVNATKQ